MTSRPSVPVICPSASSIIRSAASLRRVPWGEFPDFTGTIRRLRLLAPRRASLRLLRSALPPLRPLRSPGVGRFPEGLDHFCRGARAASSRWRRRDLPGSWTTLAYMPRSSTPADPRPQATTGPAMWPSAGFTTSAPHRTLSRLNHAACTLSVYASQPGSPPDLRNTRFRLAANLGRSGLSPAGSRRRFPSCLSVYMASPFTKLCLAQESTIWGTRNLALRLTPIA